MIRIKIQIPSIFITICTVITGGEGKKKKTLAIKVNNTSFY